MHFQVPQFIETEDKLIGPMSLKQFLYVAVAGATSFLLYFITATWLWLVLTFILVTMGVSLAFIKVNGRDMAYFLKNVFFFFWKDRVYLFQTKRASTAQQASGKYTKAVPVAPTQSKIKDIGEKLATSKTVVPKREAAMPQPEVSAPAKIRERYEIVRKIAGDRELAKKIDYR